jgi:hypothetical protein
MLDAQSCLQFGSHWIASSKRGHNVPAFVVPILKTHLKTMKTIPLFTTVVLAATLLTAGAIAQTASPTTPTPTRAAAPVPATTPAPALAGDPAAAIQPMQTPAPNQIIYIPQLPTAAALVAAATAQGVTVELINQTGTQITVVYRYGNGQINTICYQLLSTAGSAQVPVAATTAAVPPSTTVIYERGGPAYYYDPFYYPWPWYGPVSVNLGFGFHGRGGYNRGGFRGWR